MAGPHGETLAKRVAVRISALRSARRLSQATLAARLGIATRNLQRIESGKQNLTLETIERIALALEVPAESLLPNARQLLSPAPAEGAPPRCVPVIPLRAVTGLLDPQRQIEVEGWCAVEETEPGNLFVCRVDDASMEPLIPAGAYVLFRSPPEAETTLGICLWRIRTGESSDDGNPVVIRQLVGRRPRSDGGSDVTLACLNGAYPPIEVTVLHGKELRAIARLVRVLG